MLLMPRAHSNASRVVEVLRAKPGATMPQIADGIRKKHGAVPRHSIRSAVYAHLGDKGERLFRRETTDGRSGRYFLR
jgi:hypothetical protein